MYANVQGGIRFYAVLVIHVPFPETHLLPRKRRVASRTSSNSREGNTYVPISRFLYTSDPYFANPVRWSENTSNEIKVEAADLRVSLRKYLKRALSTDDSRGRFTRWDNGKETRGNIVFIDSVDGIVKRNMSTKILANRGTSHARINQKDSGQDAFYVGNFVSFLLLLNL